MRVTHLFTGPDGQSHFADLDLPTTDLGRGLETGLIPNKGVIIRDRSGLGPMDMGFHNAPRRQLVLTIGGGVEVELGDGTTRAFGPGEVLFADDVDGQGHKTRGLSGLTHMVFVALPDDFDPSVWQIT